jgi:phage-Barnase-EndoU-ColicinE5/D-RelE like nuclease3
MKKNDIIFKDLADLIQFAMNDKTNQRGFFDMGELSQEQADRLKEQTGMDFSDFKRIIDSYSLKHILKNHGNEAKEKQRGQLAITAEDLKKIPELLENPDDSMLDGLNRLGREVIKQEKNDTDTFTIIEEIRAYKKLLALDSMRKKRKKAN